MWSKSEWRLKGQQGPTHRYEYALLPGAFVYWMEYAYHFHHWRAEDVVGVCAECLRS